MITFMDGDMAKEVYNKSPWYVMNKLISLQFWNPKVSVFEVDYSKVQFWV